MWLFGNEGEPFYDVLVKYNHLRYKLMPTMYSLAGNSWLHDSNFMSPLYFAFGDDENVANIGDQFMVGSDMMVCPVYKPMYYGPNSVELHGIDKTREIYFPAGFDWIDLETNQIYAGETTQMVDADIMKLPVYIKAGGILLMGEGTRHAGEWLDHEVTVQVYDGADGNFSWYLDAGDGYGYENGEYTVVNIKFNNATKTLTISDMEGSYPNMADARTLQIKFVSEGKATEVTTISYVGKEMTVQL